MVLYFPVIFAMFVSAYSCSLEKERKQASLMTPVVLVFFSNPRKGILAAYGENFLELKVDYLPRVTKSSHSSALSEHVNTEPRPVP